MRRLHPDWTKEDIVQYNLRPKQGTDVPGTSFSIFGNTQHYRVELTRQAIAGIIELEGGTRLSIIEPGCSAGDISGFFSESHDVWGNDVVPAAVAEARQRWPHMVVEEGVSEDFKPRGCDILVMCEFLEHIADPISFVKGWGTLAKYVVISHPLVGDGHDPEKGHYWAYDIDDFRAWFEMSGHNVLYEGPFKMGYHMILGVGVKKR